MQPSIPIRIEAMQFTHQPAAIELIAAAMNDEEAQWAQQSFAFYFECAAKGIDSSRAYYVAWDAQQLCGLLGLHHYRWGPPQNVWLSWFAVHPAKQRQGIGRTLLNEAGQMARARGYRQLLIETYASPTFAAARHLYQQAGYQASGRIEQYLPDGSAMLVYSKQLE